MCKSILIHSSVSLLLVLVLMLACHAVARLRRPKAGARTLAKNRKVFILLSISRTWGRSLSFSITSMSKSKNLHDKALASLAPPFNVHDPLSQARVVEWQTRTFEGRMPKGMRVQVPPRAPPRLRRGIAESRISYLQRISNLKFSMEPGDLPICELKSEIGAALGQQPRLILQAPTG